MDILQTILISIGIVVVIFLLIAAFLPKNKYVERSIIIHKPPEKIYSLVTDFNNYRKWNPWSRREPEATGIVSGNPGQKGHRWEWEGKTIGSGNITIKKYETGKYIESDLAFTAPRVMKSKDIWKFEKLDDNKTRVKWGHYTDLGYPVERFYGLMLDKMIGPDFEQGLVNLKNLSES